MTFRAWSMCILKLFHFGDSENLREWLFKVMKLTKKVKYFSIFIYFNTTNNWILQKNGVCYFLRSCIHLHLRVSHFNVQICINMPHRFKTGTRILFTNDKNQQYKSVTSLMIVHFQNFSGISLPSQKWNLRA